MYPEAERRQTMSEELEQILCNENLQTATRAQSRNTQAERHVRWCERRFIFYLLDYFDIFSVCAFGFIRH